MAAPESQVSFDDLANYFTAPPPSPPSRNPASQFTQGVEHGLRTAGTGLVGSVAEAADLVERWRPGTIAPENLDRAHNMVRQSQLELQAAQPALADWDKVRKFKDDPLGSVADAAGYVAANTGDVVGQLAPTLGLGVIGGAAAGAVSLIPNVTGNLYGSALANQDQNARLKRLSDYYAKGTGNDLPPELG